MAHITRQSNLFAAEDWTKLYESFKDIDFRSYDYQTIRKSLIDYLRTYYPEDFNDFIESSEYIALIDMIAYQAQALSFRTDLNARENFLETAERRDSVLRLAKMVSYTPKRTQVARGLIKVVGVETTEQLFDSNGTDLQGTTVFWGDTNNPDFLEQFTTIMNAAMFSSQRFSKPAATTTIAGVNIDEYNIAIIPNTVPVFEFTQTINGSNVNFELVKGTYSGTNYLYEVAPRPSNSTNIFYRNDGRGFNSVDTGFFFYIKQGQLQVSDFTIDGALPNRIVDLEVNNIDNNDVYLYKVDSNGAENTQWSKLPSVSGTNVIYNSLSQNTKTIFSVNSKTNDQIQLLFGDGVFTDIPVGDFRTYYRVGNGLTYKIEPQDMQNVVINIPYISHSNQLETITVTLSLQNTISNGTSKETLASIKTKASQQYYTQNRMVTGEDYQIYPFTNFNDVVKAKAVNRTASGISRYLDVRDTTGKYSSTNIVAEDGILYRNESNKNFTFDFVTDSDIATVISGTLEPIVQNTESKHYYYKNYPLIGAPAGITWNQSTKSVSSVTGYFKNASNNPQTIAQYTTGNMKYATVGSLLKFTPPIGYVFDVNNNLVATPTTLRGTKEYVWASITSVIGDGTNQGVGNLTDNTGPLTISEVIPSTAELQDIIAPWNTTLPQSVRTLIINNVNQYKTFGLRYDVDTQAWTEITALNLSSSNTFDLGNAGDTTESNLDASWIYKFTNDGITYTVTYRSTEYVFESALETRFYFDPDQSIFDTTTGRTVKDTINVLAVNSQPDADAALGQGYKLNIADRFVETDGFVISEKIKVTFADADNDSVADDPEFFNKIVAPTVNPSTKIVYYKSYLDSEGYSREEPVAAGDIEAQFTTLDAINTVVQSYDAGQVFYASSEEKFYITSADNDDVKTVTLTTDYSTKVGRDNLIFQYSHNAPNTRRIDPSPSNIIDLYLLTRTYDQDYRNWVSDVTGRVSKPAQLTTSQLRDSYGSLENAKSVSDSLIFHNVSYRPLFGSKADEELQATFKVVKNSQTFISDNEVKATVIQAINDYFALENWDFGDTFYFSELSAYLHQTLAPNVLSIVIVPKKSTSVFGSLFQITSNRDEIFISSATVNDIEIIDTITSTQLAASGNVVSNAQSTIASESIVSGNATTSVTSTTNNTTSTTTTSSSSSSSSGGYGY
jgi:hypothetical protein